MYRGKYEANPKGGKQPQRKMVTQLSEETAVKAAAPVAAPPKQTKKKNKKKKITAGTVIFYTLYFIMILVAALAIRYGLGWLENWLTDFEASQPDAKCQEVFDQYFADPDWATVYDLLDSDAVGTMTKDAFVAYMEQKVGQTELTYSKTSAGLSGGRKFILRLDGQNIGTFTLTNSVTGELEIPDWKLSHVEVFVAAREYVTVLTAYGNTVTVNGLTLDESYIIRTTETTVEEYLPEGIHGPRTATYYIGGLLNAPEVTVTDANDNAVKMDYDPEARAYTEAFEISDITIAQNQYDFVLEATKTYFRFMLDAATPAQLREYFDSNTDTYKTIIKSEDPWLQDYRTYDFGTEKIYDFCRYSEDMFSVRIAMDLNVTRTNGTIKTFSVDTTFFVSRAGKTWKITGMTNVDVTQVLTKVRMTYLQDGKALSSQMVATDVTSLQLPNVVVPECKALAGWFLQNEDEKGNITYTLVFQPGEDGSVKLPAGYVLEPMELHVLFEEVK